MSTEAEDEAALAANQEPPADNGSGSTAGGASPLPPPPTPTSPTSTCNDCISPLDDSATSPTNPQHPCGTRTPPFLALPLNASTNPQHAHRTWSLPPPLPLPSRPKADALPAAAAGGRRPGQALAEWQLACYRAGQRAVLRGCVAEVDRKLE